MFQGTKVPRNEIPGTKVLGNESSSYRLSNDVISRLKLVSGISKSKSVRLFSSMQSHERRTKIGIMSVSLRQCRSGTSVGDERLQCHVIDMLLTQQASCAWHGRERVSRLSAAAAHS